MAGRFYERREDRSLGDSFAIQQDPPIEYLDDNAPELLAIALVAAREKRCDEVDALYNAKCLAGVPLDGKRFEVNAKGIAFITSMGAKAVGCLALENRHWTPLQFVTAHNTVRTFETAEEFLELADAADVGVQAMFGFAFMTKTIIRQLQTEEDVAAYDITAGWPGE